MYIRIYGINTSGIAGFKYGCLFPDSAEAIQYFLLFSLKNDRNMNIFLNEIFKSNSVNLTMTARHGRPKLRS